MGRRFRGSKRSTRRQKALRETAQTTLAIANSRIAAIGVPELMPPAIETIDAAGRHLLPGVINPPIREPGAPLFDALPDGTIDMPATDHVPHLPEEELRANIRDCGCGLPGVETSMPLMLTAINQGRMTLRQYVRASSANPARAFGLYPRKGVLQVGADADIAIVDMTRHGLISPERLHSRSRITPFADRAVQGMPVMTLVRGKIVMRGDKIVAEPGWGRLVRVQMPPPAVKNADRTTRAITDFSGASNSFSPN